MEQAWASVRKAACRLITEGSSAAEEHGRLVSRLTDLAIAAVAAAHQGLLSSGLIAHLDGEGLRDAVMTLALAPLPPLPKASEVWDALAREADLAAGWLHEPSAVDGWVAASQMADPDRKFRGAYATPVPFANCLAQWALRPVSASRKPVRVVDPSAGSGALLLASLRVLQQGQAKNKIRSIVENLHGMEIDAASRELCCLLLWIAAAPSKADLAVIASNIVLGNALTHDWWSSSAPFDALLMNPPWDSLRHQTSDTDPNSDARAATLARLWQQTPGDKALPLLYSAQGIGDRNLFKAFVELAPHLVREGGCLGALLPAAFASDLGMSPLRKRYFEQVAIERWTSFENLRGHFPIDGRYKFGLLIGKRSINGTQSMEVRSFAVDPIDIETDHATISREDLPRLGGAGLRVPEFRNRGEAEILSRVVDSGTPLFSGGSFGKVLYKRELDLTLGRLKGHFIHFADHPDISPRGDGSYVSEQGAVWVPVVEGRMVGQYDFWQKSWINGQRRTASWETNNALSLAECRPQFIAPPRAKSPARLALCDVTSSTNTRTVHATWVPETWPCGNTAPVLLFEQPRLARAALAVLNSMVFDWVARRIVAGLHLNKFYLEEFMWPHLNTATIERLVQAADVLCMMNKRFEGAGGKPLSKKLSRKSAKCKKSSSLPQDQTDHTAYVNAHLTIEREVAYGFSLTTEMLHRIYDSSIHDRRGFWRYFASEKRAVCVVENFFDIALPIEAVTTTRTSTVSRQLL